MMELIAQSFWLAAKIDPSWCLVIVGIITAFVIGWQSWETRKSAEAASLNVQALVNAERARIGFEVDEMGRSFRIDAKNTGKTACRIVYARGFTKTLAGNEELPSDPCYIDYPDDNSEWIGPGEKFDIMTAPDRYGLVADLSDIELCRRIRDKQSKLWIFGCIRYFDGVSEDKREKRFCFSTSVNDDSLETCMFPAGPEQYRMDT